jgi:hypothetical protein
MTTKENQIKLQAKVNEINRKIEKRKQKDNVYQEITLQLDEIINGLWHISKTLNQINARY